MKKPVLTAALVLVVGAGALVSMELASQDLTRRRAAALLEAEFERRGPIIYRWSLTPLVESRTPDHQPNIDLNAVTRKLESFIFMPDQEYCECAAGRQHQQ